MPFYAWMDMFGSSNGESTMLTGDVTVGVFMANCVLVRNILCVNEITA